MGRKKKVAYNHDADCAYVAAGLNEDQMESKYGEVVDGINESEGTKTSIVAETFENAFNKRELSIILAFKLLGEAESCCQVPDPIAELLGGGMPRRSGNPMEALLALAALSKLKSELEA